jgi:hypothetical protein
MDEIIKNLNQYISFLGIAEFIEQPDHPFGNINIFQLSKYKYHFIYPAETKNHQFVFLIKKELLEVNNLEKIEIEIIDDSNRIIANRKFKTEKINPSELGQQIKIEKNISIVPDNEKNFLAYFKINGLIEKPGEYKIIAKMSELIEVIDNIHFFYIPSPPLTSEEILAIESNPNSAKAIIQELGCLYCDKKMKVYSSITKIPQLENEGCVNHRNVQGEFVCN